MLMDLAQSAMLFDDNVFEQPDYCDANHKIDTNNENSTNNSKNNCTSDKTITNCNCSLESDSIVSMSKMSDLCFGESADGWFCPIFIPSKGRHKSERGTISLLIRDQIPFTVVVQPEEVTSYEQLIDRLVNKWWGDDKSSGAEISNGGHSGGVSLLQRYGAEDVFSATQQQPLSLPPCTPPQPPQPLSSFLALPARQRSKLVSLYVKQLKVESLPLSDMGVSYVRNYILKVLVPSAFKNLSSPSLTTDQWFWVLDDDIQRFNIARNDKNHVITPRQMFFEVYTRIKGLHGDFCDMNEVAIFSLEYSIFAYRYGNQSIALNSYNNIACLFHYNLIPQECSYRFRIREDYDFTLQIINHGLKTARFRNLSFEVPGMAEAAGGMTDYYKGHKKDIAQQNIKFLETWPAVAHKCIKGKGALQREDIRVRWDLLNPKKSADPRKILSSRVPLKVVSKKNVPLNTVESNTEVVENVKKIKGEKLKEDRQCGEVKRSRSNTYKGGKLQFVELEKTKTTLNNLALHNKTNKKTITTDVKLCCTKPGWKGYVLERWRQLSVEEAKKLYLVLIPTESLRLGRTVAVVPPMFDQNPSVVEAVLVDKTVTRRRRRVEGVLRDSSAMTDVVDVEEEKEREEEENDVIVEWSVVARGMPLLSVRRCYEIPSVGIDVAAAAVDKFFEIDKAKEAEKVV